MIYLKFRNSFVIYQNICNSITHELFCTLLLSSLQNKNDLSWSNYGHPSIIRPFYWHRSLRCPACLQLARLKVLQETAVAVTRKLIAAEEGAEGTRLLCTSKLGPSVSPCVKNQSPGLGVCIFPPTGTVSFSTLSYQSSSPTGTTRGVFPQQQRTWF